MGFKIASLFSGCGGLDEGFRMAGDYEVVWANDIYLPSCRTFAKNFGLELTSDPKAFQNSLYSGDVEAVDFSNLAPRNEIDVITGGPPCQDFSIIRGAENRKGTRVKRGKLYLHFVRALVTLQPKFFLFENVKGLISANRGKAFRQIKEDFMSLNLRWSSMLKNHSLAINNLRSIGSLESYELLFSHVVDFSMLGVPQQRKRVIIIGIRKDLAGKLDNLSGVINNIEKKLRGYNDILSSFPLTSIEYLTGKTLSELDDYYKEIIQQFDDIKDKIDSDRSLQYFSEIRKKTTLDIWRDYFSAYNHPATVDEEEKKKRIIERHSQILEELGYFGRPVEELELEDMSSEILPEREHVKERMKFVPPGENHEFVKGTPHNVIGLMSNIYKRIHPLRLSPTVIARGGGGTWGYHYHRSRQRLSNRERARLQTFPDTFLFEGGTSQVRRQIGEAVPPLAGKVIALIIKDILSGNL